MIPNKVVVRQKIKLYIKNKTKKIKKYFADIGLFWLAVIITSKNMLLPPVASIQVLIKIKYFTN